MSHARTRARKAGLGAALFGLLISTLAGTTLLASSARAATTYTLQVSTGCARPSPVALNGAVVKGNVFVYTDPATTIKTVGFWLDDPTHTTTATHTEGTGPYDFAGGFPDCANPWDTTKLADGKHTITQVVTPTTGAVQVFTATFTIANTTATSSAPPPSSSTPPPPSSSTATPPSSSTPPPPSSSTPPPPSSSTPPPPSSSTATPPSSSAAVSSSAASGFSLQLSALTTRANSIDLNGATVTGNAYVFTNPGTGIKSVGFWLDDPTHTTVVTHNETTAPYDFAGGSATAALAWDTTKVSNGQHTLTQVVTPTTGAVQVITATFTVANGVTSTSPPPTSSAPASSSASPSSSSPSSSPTGSTPPGGAPGWGLLQPTNLDWTKGPAATAIASLLGQPLTNLRYEMNRTGLDVADKTTTLHTKPDATMRLTNKGTVPVTISSVTTTGPFTLQTALVGPQIIAPGGTLDVTVLFTYCRTGCSSATPKSVQSGTMSVTSDDPGFPTESVSLFGGWTYDAFGNNELTVQQFVNTQFGLKTVLTGPGAKYINYGNGLNAAVGDEVLAPYWKAATPGTVYVRQIVATHGPGAHEPFAWFPQGNVAGRHIFLQQAATDAQTVLPGGSAGPDAEGSFAPGAAVFGFQINGTENTDPTLTDAAGLANDARHGCDTVNTQCGHHTRMYPVKDAAGAVVPNLYLLLVDSEGTNLDFQDVIYLITNITPAS